MTCAADFEIVFSGPVADVRLSPIASREFQKVCVGTDQRSVKRKAHLTRYFEEFCAREPHRLSMEKFKKQDDFADGKGGQVAVYEFKAWQWRLYGAILRVGGKKCFVGVKVDHDKKSDRADRALLAAAAKEISELPEYINGRTTTLGAKDGNQKSKRR